MLLDIVVPHYNEPWEIVRPFINMINSQKGVDFRDFRVLLVHDGVDPFPEKYLEGPANIQQIVQEKRGVSAARNYGIDHSEAKWINFSDCDDCYSSVLSLYLIFNVLRDDEQYNLFWSPFYMVRSDNTLRQFPEYTPVFIHNKYYRLSFLKEKDIRFCEKLHMSEDSAFNAIVEARMKEGLIGSIDYKFPLYAWCRRKGSVTLNPDIAIYNMEGHFDRNLYVLDEFRKHPALNSDIMVGRTLTDAYAMLTKPDLNGDASKFLKRVSEFYLENREAYQGISEADKAKLLRVSDLESGITEEIRASRKPLDEWLESLV